MKIQPLKCCVVVSHFVSLVPLLTMFIIGLTGGIATGKSTVTQAIRNLGIQVIDADEISREVVKPGTRGHQSIKKVFGPQVFDPETDELNRDLLGQIIFNDAAKRKQLNAIVHPKVIWEMIKRCLLSLWHREKYVVLDLPLLFEVGTFSWLLSYIIVVRCNKDQQLNRLMARNDYSQEEATSRINAQMDLELKCSKADFVIDNDKTFREVEDHVICLFKNELPKVLNSRFRYLLLDSVLAITTSIVTWTLIRP